MPRKSESTDFQTLAYQLISRRGFTEVGLAFGASAFFTGTAGPGGALTASRLGFKQVAANSLDTITVPKGYSWHVVSSWGDPLGSEGAKFNHESRGSGASQERAFGHNNNGMVLFRTDDRNILVVNNEYVNLAIFYGNRASKQPENLDDQPKAKAAHSVSGFEIEQQNGTCSIVKDSPYNRRITADTPMEITGPARRCADRKTLFIGIQHPGEKGGSHFPGGGGTEPRSSIVAITKDGGGFISQV